jgi:pilus assembly protein CpaB
VLCAVAATLTGLTALAPPRPPTVEVVRATADLAGGVVLTGTHLRRDGLPRDALPSEALADPAAAVGRMLAGRVPSGQILTSADLVGGRSPTTAGQVIAPVRLADSDVTALIADGDLVDVVRAEEQTGSAKIVATRVRVVGVPASARDSVAAGTGGLILVEVDPQTATALASASISARLSVIWR